MNYLSRLKIRQFKKIFFILAMPVFSFYASAASFDCAKATEVVEKIICGSQELSEYDRQLSSAYVESVKKNQSDKQRIKQEQLAWIAKRNECEYSFDCLKSAYKERLSVLTWDELAEHRNPFSWGGKIRQQPSLYSPQVGSTHNGQVIKVVGPTEIIYNNYHWFEVEADGVTGFQWGGILCAPVYSSMSYCEE